MKKIGINHSSLSSAFQHVKEKHGCAGVDGVTIERFEENLDLNLARLQDELVRQTYFPFPLMKILVEKKTGEPRALCIPAVKDRVVETAVLQVIEPLLEKEFEDCSFAYRKGRSVKQAVYKIRDYYDKGYRWVVDADIDAFFDSVDHKLLLAKFKQYIHDPQIQRLVELWLAAEIWDGTSLKVCQKGIPQGSPISPILANLFLDELDEKLLRKGYKYIRFADDYVILCKKEEEAENGLELSKQILEKLLLKLDEEEITTFDQGFKYLGIVFLKSMVMKPFEVQKKNRKVLFYPKPFNIGAYLLKKKKNF
jgi:group II intron reverse transcriptase/maturase